MSIATPITILATPTAILSGSSQATGRPPLLLNLSDETITLTWQPSGDTFDLGPGELIEVPSQAQVTGTSSSGTAQLQVLRSLRPLAAGGALKASFDESTGSLQVTRLNPEWGHTGPLQYSDSALGDGTYYEYFDLEGYDRFSVGVEDTPGVAGTNTYTVEAAAKNDGTQQESSTYFDVTQTLFGVANLTTSGLFPCTVSVAFKHVRVKVVRSADGGNTDGAYLLDIQRS